jgi:hypothetical protein
MRFAIAGVNSISSAQIEYLLDTASSLVSMNIHNQINAAPNVRLDGIQVHATASAHHQGSKAM